MAKKVKDASEMPSVFDMMKGVDATAEVIADSAYSNISEWIPTGSYILNACMSGDLFKAIPSGRVISLCGTSGAGKSFLACSICREAQLMGYTPIYMDSEGAIDAKFVERLGVDSSKLLIKQVSTISETSQFIAKTCDALQAQMDEYGSHQKVILVLDSLGNLTSDKERTDIVDGNNKRDMTKAQEIKALFRVNATPLARMQVPMVVINHVYSAVGSYVPTNVQAGGCLVPDTKVITTEGAKAIKDIVIGDKVLSHDGEYHEVEKTWNFKKPTYTFKYENGETLTCSNTHRFLVDIEHPEKDTSWKTADELTVGDEIYMLG